MNARLVVIMVRALAASTRGATFLLALFSQLGLVAIAQLWVDGAGRTIQIFH
jgi:hypothetical protein